MESLDDIALFLTVAETGSLSAAARSSGHSVPTLSRRMAALERSLGQRLFERGPQGYGLTAMGACLRDEALPLREVAMRLHRFTETSPAPKVRITAGTWTARFLAQNLNRLWSPTLPWVPDLLPSSRPLDVARREADIGLRNRRPEQDWLAGRRTSIIRFREYGTAPEVTGYLSLSADAPSTPSSRWLEETHGNRIVASAPDPRLLADLSLSGLGRVVLPTFAGDSLPGLKPLSPVIEALTHEEWLVSHHEARNDPPVRAALDALATLLTDQTLRSQKPAAS